MNEPTQRIGRILVNHDFVANDIEGVSEVLKLLSFVPYRVESRWDLQRLEMIGISPLFEETSNACVAPDYHIHLSISIDEETNKRTVAIHKVEKAKDFRGTAIDNDYPPISHYAPPKPE